MGLGRHIFTVSLPATSISPSSPATKDIIELHTGVEVPIMIYSIRLGQISDAGDAEEELLEVNLSRINTSGSGGTVLTPVPHSASFGPTFEISSVDAEGLNSTPSSSATPIFRDVWNTQSGYLYQPMPYERPVIAKASRCVLRISSPADVIDIVASITWEEFF